jgi:hypothetical protein
MTSGGRRLEMTGRDVGGGVRGAAQWDALPLPLNQHYWLIGLHFEGGYYKTAAAVQVA